MLSLLDIKDIHTDQPAAILGGGPSLMNDVGHIPPHSLLIGVNDHAIHAGILPDMLVVMDDPACKPALLQVVNNFNGLIISKHREYSDVELIEGAYWRDLSSMTAAWIAAHMGCAPILLCGMDCYQGTKMYCHDKDDGIPKAIYKRTLDQHLAHWRKAFDRIPHPGRIRAVSGPLLDVFGS